MGGIMERNVSGIRGMWEKGERWGKLSTTQTGGVAERAAIEERMPQPNAYK
jgi:hypothetical protein